MNDIITYLRKHSSFENPVSGGVLADKFGLTGQKVREYINQARRNGIPICSTRWGYFYSDDKAQIKKTIESMRGRIAAQEMAIDGLSTLLGGAA